MTAPSVKMPFSNVQMELLRLYANDVPDQDLLELKKVMATFFFKKMRVAADKTWKTNNLTDSILEKVD